MSGNAQTKIKFRARKPLGELPVNIEAGKKRQMSVDKIEGTKRLAVRPVKTRVHRPKTERKVLALKYSGRSERERFRLYTDSGLLANSAGVLENITGRLKNHVMDHDTATTDE